MGNNHPMNNLQLPKTYGKPGYAYNLVKESAKGAVYEQIYKESGQLHGWEVFKKRIAKAGIVFGRPQPDRYQLPSNEDFGQVAWSVSVLSGFEQAEKVLQEIEQGIRPMPKITSTLPPKTNDLPQDGI